jgi:ribose transport system permease protein
MKLATEIVTSNKRKDYISKAKSILSAKSVSTLLVFIMLCFLVFILCDILKINNDRGRAIFLTKDNILNVLNQISMNAIIAFGMTFVILIGGIDLSVGSIVAIAGVSGAVMLANAGLPLIIIIPVIILIGLAVGFGNGVIVAKLKIPAFVVTLASMTVFRGIALIIVDGKPIFIDDQAFKFIGNGFVFGGVIPVPIIILALVFLGFHILLTKTKFGRYTYVIGGNEETAKLSGINVDKIKLWIFMLNGAAAAISGLILASRLGSGQPNAGQGYELDAIAAAIVGGTSVSGGIGTITGTIIGALIIGVINNGMNLLGVSPYFQYVVKGSVILIAVIIDRLSQK